MSHFTKLKTKLHCLRTTEKSLKDMGFKVDKSRDQVRGFGSQRRFANLVVDTGSGLDIGFVETDDGIEIFADWDYIGRRAKINKAEFTKTLKKTYAYNKVLEEAEKAGFTLVEERNEEGTVCLRVRRWA